VGLYVLRLVALMVDCTVLFTVLAAPQFAIMALTGRWFLDQNSAGVVTWAWVFVSVVIPSFVYFAICDRMRDGVTVGKRVTRLSVRPTDGTPMTWSRAIVRNAVKLIPWEATHIMIFFPEPFSDDPLSTGKIMLMSVANVLLVVWLVVPLLDRPDFRAVHDRVASTRVVVPGS
jgi:uncharacterized RDD family membrane protein YckC